MPAFLPSYSPLWPALQPLFLARQPKGRLPAPNADGWIGPTRCPWRDDAHPSLSIKLASEHSPGAWRDHATGEAGSMDHTMSTHRDGLRGKGVPVGRRWARVREQHGRLLLAFYAADRATFYAIKDDLRATFHRHRDGFWSPTRHAWSLPAHHRPLLQEWLASWFPPIPSPGLLAPPR